MIRETDQAVLDRLTSRTETVGGIQIRYMDVDVLGNIVPVPLDIGPVEEFLKRKVWPSLNVMPLIPVPDLSRHSTFVAGGYDQVQHRAWKQRFSLPYTLMYQIDFIAKMRGHAVAIMEAIYKNLPPIGFGQEIVVAGYEMPYRYLATPQDLTKYDTTEDREFRWVVTLALEGWCELPKEYTTDG